MNLKQTEFGFEIRTTDLTVFLGGINSQFTNLLQAYPQFRLMRLKQIHSDSVVPSYEHSPDYTTLADAHFTKEKNLALCIITADCVPLFFYDSSSGLISGVHAGWRGVASRIIPKTIRTLLQHGASAGTITTIIGPHIRKNSFEVGNDVRDKILNSITNSDMSNKYKIDASQYSTATADEKSLVDLNLVVRTQLQQEGLNLEQVFDLNIDTVESSHFHSYRRDKENSGRQISFICRTL